MAPKSSPRIEKLRASLKEKELDAMIVLDRVNSVYLSGFKTSYSVIIVDRKSARFITDARYGEAAAKAIDGFEVIVQPTTKVKEFFIDLYAKSGYGKAGFEGSISVDQLASLRAQTKKTKLVKAGELVTNLRRVKDADEIKSIKAATKLADDMMAYALTLLKPGVVESDVSRKIRFASEELGGEGESFSNIVASGPNSSRPHHRGGSRKMKVGDPVTVDLGALKDGYCSDLTRTPVIGKVSKKFEEIYNVCLAANEAAIKAAKPGMTGIELDEVAREVIRTAGYEAEFGHGLGHGVGLEIHEAPTLSPRADKKFKLEAGNIVTIEPGIYIPGFGGVRIEDYILLIDKGSQVLSKAPKHLQVLPA